MTDPGKPRLLFLRFTRGGLPGFIQLHLQQQVDCLAQHFDVTVFSAAECDYARLCEIHLPDMVLFESGVYVGPRRVTNVNAHPQVPKLGFLHCDAFCSTRKIALDDMAKWGIDSFMTTSVAMAGYTPSIADNLFVWPNFVDTDLYRDYGLPKIVPVLFTGSQAIHYPWRNRVNRALSQYFPTLQCPHFGWDARAVRAGVGVIFGEPYARTLNAASFAPACGSFANDLVRKHLEIPACNTCLVTERTSATDAAGFVDMENCVLADETTVVDKVATLIQQPAELERITRAGRELVGRRHTMRSRDEIFQWFQLRRRLGPGQRIIQRGPFQPLTLTSAGAARVRTLAGSKAIDRILMAKGDALMWGGQYIEADRLYRRCLNYYDMPEPRLRLALCKLFQGKAMDARRLLAEGIGSSHARGGPESEPDPVEWAYLIVSLLCGGELRMAADRATQYPDLCHVEFERVLWVLAVLYGRRSVDRAKESRAPRASVHALPTTSMRVWRRRLCAMLRACGQDDLAAMLEAARGSLDRVPARTPKRSPGIGRRQLSMTTSGLLGRTIIERMILRGIKKSVSAYTHLVDRVLSRRPSSPSEAHASLIRSICQFEDLRSAALIGAASGSWLTEAFLAGVAESPNVPKALCLSVDPAALRALEERFAGSADVKFRVIHQDSQSDDFAVGHDAILVDCSELQQPTSFPPVLEAQIVVIDDVCTEIGSNLLRVLVADNKYCVVAQEFRKDDGFAVLRKAPGNLTQLARAEVIAEF